MNQSKKLINIIWCLILTILLIVFMLLSLNSVLPLKQRFPSWRLSPHLTAREEQTANGTRTDYINTKGKITVALDKNYATVIRTLDQDGNCLLEQYFDSHGKPAVLTAGNSALQREYNSDGKWISSTYLDDNLDPIDRSNVYVSIHRTFNKDGKVETETYFDANGLPAIDSSKKYGIRYEYDENKRLSTATNLDPYGNPMNNKQHYAVKKISYTSDGKLYMEVYYEADDKPARLSFGEFGYIYENGRPVCIDQNGHRFFSLRHFLLHSVIAVLLIGAALLLIIMLSRRTMTWILLLSYIAFIAYMTVMDREAGLRLITWKLPPNYYLFFTDREVLANIWLFIPLGTLFYKLSHMWEIVALPIALSLIIEVSQLVFGIGAFEFSDLLANSLGGIIGVIICYLLQQRQRRPDDPALP